MSKEPWVSCQLTCSAFDRVTMIPKLQLCLYSNFLLDGGRLLQPLLDVSLAAEAPPAHGGPMLTSVATSPSLGRPPAPFCAGAPSGGGAGSSPARR